MQERKPKVGVFISRMSIPHNGHVALIKKAIEENDIVVILIGSSYRSRSPRNPFTYSERLTTIVNVLQVENKIDMSNVFIRPIQDVYNDNVWILNVQMAVLKIANMCCGTRSLSDVDVSIYFSSKEEETAYPNWFPMWKRRRIDALTDESGQVIAATDLRLKYFSPSTESDALREIESYTPASVIEFLDAFSRKPAYAELCAEQAYYTNYKKETTVGPYGQPNFVTCDAVVVQSGHILLIERKDLPGRGLWALPGGFLENSETLLDASIRELTEETGLKVPQKVLRGSLVSSKEFADPKRSERGRVITHAFYFKLDDSMSLPRVKGSSDAKAARWVSLAEVMLSPMMFFEDHKLIIDYFVGTTPYEQP